MRFFDQVAPCNNCPFKKSAFIGLKPGRREEIANALLHEDKSFSCHKSLSGETDEDTQEYTPGPNDLMCAGAMILMRNERVLLDNRLTRIAIGFGWLEPDNLIDTGVYPTVEGFIKGE